MFKLHSYFCVQLSYVLLQYDYMVCPISWDEVKEELSMDCERAPVFKLAEYALPKFVMNILSLVRTKFLPRHIECRIL